MFVWSLSSCRRHPDWLEHFPGDSLVLRSHQLPAVWTVPFYMFSANFSVPTCSLKMFISGLPAENPSVRTARSLLANTTQIPSRGFKFNLFIFSYTLPNFSLRVSVGTSSWPSATIVSLGGWLAGSESYGCHGKNQNLGVAFQTSSMK